MVIGGTSGIGHAIALALAEAGADVVPTARRQPLVDAACEQVRKLGRQTIACTVDVRDGASLAGLLDRVVGRFGRVDVLVNAAGAILRKPTIEMTEPEWQEHPRRQRHRHAARMPDVLPGRSPNTAAGASSTSPRSIRS